MSLTLEEKAFINSLPRRYSGCAILQAARDKSLRAALLTEFNNAAIVDRAMTIIKGQR